MPKLAILVSSSTDMQLIRDILKNNDNPSSRRMVSRLMMTQIYVGENFSITGPITGAAYAAIVLEQLIAWGAEEILYVGWCGSLVHELKIGDILIPSGAIADEGTTPGYDGEYHGLCRPSQSLSDKLKNILSDKKIAFSERDIWTTDAIYRETPEKIKKFQDMGAAGVEMELSALFTVSGFRGVSIASIQIVSDELATLSWRPGFREQAFKDSRRTAGEVIRDYVSQYKNAG